MSTGVILTLPPACLTLGLVVSWPRAALLVQGFWGGAQTRVSHFLLCSPAVPPDVIGAELFSVHIGGFPWEGSANLEVSGSPRGYLDAGHAGSLPLERSKVWPAAGRPSRGWNEISGGKGGAGRGFGSSGAHSMGLAGKICWKDVFTCLGFSG